MNLLEAENAIKARNLNRAEAIMAAIREELPAGHSDRNRAERWFSEAKRCGTWASFFATTTEIIIENGIEL